MGLQVMYLCFPDTPILLGDNMQYILKGKTQKAC